jgi:hypothetical protein
MTIAYDLSSGKKLWQKRHVGAGKDYDACIGLAITPDSSTVVTTGESFKESSDLTTIAYDVATGTPLWIKRLDGPGKASDHGGAIAVTPDGKYVVVTGQSTKTTADILTISYETTTGATSWSKYYDGPAHDNDTAVAIAMMPDGLHVAVAGHVGVVGSDDMVTIAYEV